MHHSRTEVIPLQGGIVFTPELRRKLRKKRQTLCLDYIRLGAILGLHWTTVRNWEKGRVLQCQRKNLRKLRDFLAGNLDARIIECQEEPHRHIEASARLTHQIFLNCLRINLEYLDWLGGVPKNAAPTFLDRLNETLQPINHPSS